MTLIYGLYPIWPEIILALGGMAVLMLGAFGAKDRGGMATALAGIILLAVIYFIGSTSGKAITMFGSLITLTTFTQYIKLLIAIAVLLALMLSWRWLKDLPQSRFEYPVLLMFACLGMMLMVSSNHLITFYLALELWSLAHYVLASFSRDSEKSNEAGLKYFVLGALASGMFLFGASLVYGFTGALNFDILKLFFTDGASPPPGYLVGMVLLIIGVSFKLSAVPFHMWTPDVYEGAPTPVTALFATAPKIAGLAFFARMLYVPFEHFVSSWQPIVIFLSFASMLIGGLGAIMQKNIKRLLAYSSIGHVGFALVGMSAASLQGVQGVIIYISLYLFMSAGAFACVLSIRQQGAEVNEDIASFAGLSRRQPVVAALYTIFLFSMAGIPPLAGFFGKMYVFLAAIESGLFYLAILGVLTSVIACFYYLKLVKLMYFDAPLDDAPAASVPWELRAVLLLATVVTLFYFVMPTPINALASNAAHSLAVP